MKLYISNYIYFNFFN